MTSFYRDRTEMLPVRRFESNDVTNLKGAAAAEAQSDTPFEKGNDVGVNNHSGALAVGSEEVTEKFEWREVIRGL